MNECRKILEEDLGLPEKSLRSEKAYVKELIEVMVFLNLSSFGDGSHSCLLSISRQILSCTRL